MRRAPLAAAVALSVAALAAGVHEAGAQRVDPRRPAALVVGAPPGPSPMQRVDGRRTGASAERLPEGTLRIAWRKTTGAAVDQPALAGAGGLVAVVSTRGDVTFFDAAGEDRGAVKLGAAHAGPATMTSDGTVVFATSSGEAIGIRRTSREPRFATRIGGERNVRAAPLSLHDGGVVLATLSDLVVLDAEGNVRTRVGLPEPPAAPLVAAGDEVLAVTTSGAVYGWVPGREPVRLGSFGAPVDGGAVLTERRTLLAVVEGSHLAEVDLARGDRGTRSIAASGLYLGPPALGRAADGTTSIALLALTPSRGFVVRLDAAGQELVRAPIATFTPITLPDGGAPTVTAPRHVGPIVDGAGAVAFASTDGHVGVVHPDGSVDTIGEVPCARGPRSGVVGLTPLGRGAFAVTCDGGVLVRIEGATVEPLRGPAPPPSAASPAPSPAATN